MKNDDQKFVSDREAAKLLGISVSSLRRWRYTGKGPKFYRICGSTIRYSRDDLADYIAQSVIGPSQSIPPEAA